MTVEVLSLWRGVIARRETMREVATAVAAKHGLTLDELIANDQSQRIVRVRHEAMSEVREATGKSDAEIGRLFRREHTTVWHGRRSHARRLAREQRHDAA